MKARNTLQAEYISLTFELMSEAYTSGIRGTDISNIIEELQERETPLMKATAAVLLKSYHDGVNARPTAH